MNETRESFIQKNAIEQNVVKMAQMIYAEGGTKNRDYYNNILNAIYMRVGKTDLLFVGVVTAVKHFENKCKIELCNVFWENVYICNHVWVMAKRGDCRYYRGDFAVFKASIDNYDTNRYMLTDFEEVTHLSKFINLGTPEKQERSTAIKELLYQPYEYKRRLYDKLCLESQTRLILDSYIPSKYYTAMVISLYFRYQKDDYLYKLVNEEVPEEEDLNNLLLIHLFIKWLTVNKGVYNPSQIFFCTLQFISELTISQLNEISKRNNIELKKCKFIDGTLFIKLLDSETFYLKNHVIEFANSIEI